MQNNNDYSPRTSWMIMLSAAAIMMITMGARQTTGLFLSPLNSSTHLGIVSISFAMAVGQFMWGASQPIFGAVADKFGPARVLLVGAVMLAVGTALTPFMNTEWGLIMTMGMLSAAGAGAGSFSILIGATSQRLPVQRRAFASGFINAGGSFGQAVFAQLMQRIISSAGWVTAMLTMAATTLLTIPLIWPLRKRKEAGAVIDVTVEAQATSKTVDPADIGLWKQVKIAMRNPSYIYLHLGFFTCGFHIAFLVTHLPGEVALCGLSADISATALMLIGLFNIAGSLTVGALASRHRMKYLLVAVYGSRALLIVLYLLAPKTAWTFYLFAAGLGFSWLATVPPTAGLVAKLFGTRYLATLFGLTLLSHQIGGFLGAYLGGLAFAKYGNFNWMWYVDILLATAAALINLPIREAKLPRAVLA
ncbi:MAG TPA: MFS transporter [Burkholderiaceae bacterium]|jgi:MFS family permease